MRFKVNVLLPCATYFAAGEVARAAGSIVMQASLVLWPTAYRMAREFAEARALEQKLDELSVIYRPVAADPKNAKRFQSLVGGSAAAPAAGTLQNAA